MNHCCDCGIGIPDTEDCCENCAYEYERWEQKECEFCCHILPDHAINCPENESSFAQLIQKGYC